VRRLQTVGLVATLALVALLLSSAVAGLFSRPSISAPAPPDALAALEGERVRVEVLNGSGIGGAAREATRALRRQGFDVVYFGNAPGPARDSTVVLDRAGRPDDAERVARALGIAAVAAEPDASLLLEATVILGRDWNGAAARASTRPAAP
jgi:hypothetical protein